MAGVASEADIGREEGREGGRGVRLLGNKHSVGMP